MPRSDATWHPPKGRLVALMQHLTNGQFRIELDRLYDKLLSVGNSQPKVIPPTEDAVCRCGCGEVVTPPRRFVNQSHQVVWMQTHRPSDIAPGQ